MARFKAEKSTAHCRHLAVGELDFPHREVTPGRLVPPCASHPEQAGGIKCGWVQMGSTDRSGKAGSSGNSERIWMENLRHKSLP